MTDRPALARRRFLQLSGVAATAALAGCLGDDDPPPLAEWVPARDGGQVVAYLNLDPSAEPGDDADSGSLVPELLPSQEAIFSDGEEPGEVELALDVEGIDDPLVQLPTEVGGQVLGFSFLAFAFAGLYEFVDEDAVETDEFLVLDDVFALTGGFEADTIDDRLREEPADPQLGIQYAAVDEVGSYALYEPRGDQGDQANDDEPFVAVDDGVILSSDRRQSLEAVIETSTGEREAAVDQFETFEWLVETVGEGDILVGTFGGGSLEEYAFEASELPALELLAPADDLLVALSAGLDGDGTTVELALESDDMDTSRRERLESALGRAGEDVSRTVDGDRIVTTATYPGAVLETTGDGDESEEELQFDEEELDDGNRVVDEISFDDPEPNLATVRLTDHAGVEADAVRIETVESGEETEFSGGWESAWTTVSLDPDGDQVVVSTIVDGNARIIHRETYTPPE